MVDNSTYRFIKQIGNGNYGCVSLYQTVTNGELCAIKEAKDPKYIDSLRKEEECLRKCYGFPHVVQMFSSKIYNHYGYIVLEVALADLQKVMMKPQNANGLPADMITDLIQDMTCALLFFEKEQLAHRDIKANNILVFPTVKSGRRTEYLFKLCDLGGSRETSQAINGMQSIVGTYITLHPKIAGRHCGLYNGRYTAIEVDLWSFGATLFSVATNRIPFNVQSEMEYFKCVSKKPKGAICFNDNSYRSDIENNKYRRWFTLALSKFISELLDNPDYKTLQEMSEAFVNSKECKFVVANTSKVIKHADLSHCASFKSSNPNLDRFLNISEETPAYILNKQGIQYKTAVLSSDFDDKEPSFVLHQPVISDLQLPGHNLMKIPQNISMFNDMTLLLNDMEQECFDLIAQEEYINLIINSCLYTLQDIEKGLRSQLDVVKSMMVNKINETYITETINKLEQAKELSENIINTQTIEKLENIHSTIQHTLRQYAQPKNKYGNGSIQLNNNQYLCKKFRESCKQHVDFQQKHEENNMKFIEQAKSLIEWNSLLKKFGEQLKEIMKNASHQMLNNEGSIRSQIALEQLQINDLLKSLKDIVKNNQ